jgi:hypothetical protein
MKLANTLHSILFFEENWCEVSVGSFVGILE